MRRPLLLALLLLAPLASCDSQHQAEDTRPEIQIGRLICGGHLPLAVVEKRFQSALPFRVKAVQNHDWNDVAAAMARHELVGTFILAPLAMDMIRHGLNARIVLLADRNGNSLVLAKRHATIESLKGAHAVIAVPHRYSQHHLLLYLALRQHHVPYRDVAVVGMAPRDMINALERGEIDGFVVGEPEGHRAEVLGIGHVAATSPEIWPDHADHVFIVAQDFIDQHPQQLRALIHALQRAGAFIERHPDEAAVMGQDYTGASAEVFRQVLTDPRRWIDYSDMRPTMERMRALARVMVQMGLWSDMPTDLARYVDARFVQ